MRQVFFLRHAYSKMLLTHPKLRGKRSRTKKGENKEEEEEEGEEEEEEEDDDDD